MFVDKLGHGISYFLFLMFFYQSLLLGSLVKRLNLTLYSLYSTTSIDWLPVRRAADMYRGRRNLL